MPDEDYDHDGVEEEDDDGGDDDDDDDVDEKHLQDALEVE